LPFAPNFFARFFRCANIGDPGFPGKLPIGQAKADFLGNPALTLAPSLSSRKVSRVCLRRRPDSRAKLRSEGALLMLMTLDHWLARFFGAGRRDYSERPSRAAPMAQRAAFGCDGLEMRQIDSDFDYDDEDESEPVRPPYAPYYRRPRAILPERAASFDPFAPAPETPRDFLPLPPAFEREQDELEARTTQRSKAFFRDLAVAPAAAPQPAPASPQAQPEPRFHAENIIDALENAPSPHFWRVDQPHVRFTRTPESALTRRRAEQEERRRTEEEARLKAEEEALRVQETRLAQAHSPNAESQRVRYARTPNRARTVHDEPIESAPPEAPATPRFGAFAAMGARFSFTFGVLAEKPQCNATPEPEPAPEPAPAPAPAPAPIEKPEKIRVRVKAGASPAQQANPAPQPEPAPQPAPLAPAAPVPAPVRMREKRLAAPVATVETYEPLAVDMLSEPPETQNSAEPDEQLEVNSDVLEKTLEDFGVRGDILNAHPGPVVTLYEFEPAPGIKSSRVIGLADDIARSMSAISARVAVVPGRNAIGIELPNPRRETVYLRELVASPDFTDTKHKLAIALGKTIGGEPVIVDLAKMPHLLVAGTTGSGKSVAINTMILSLLYRLKPQECRLIMVDPKMLELSVYDGIPHLLTPVVTDPKKAVVALKWAVREMEDRYKKMSKLGVRNIDGFNARVSEARAKGEIITRTVQTGFDRETGEAIYEQEHMDLSALPYIVVIVDEMADLMMVAGKEIEGAIQRLAQMARAAGIHLIMATQRPSVDVITGTIKANFPTRISFQVTSKIDSRTILGEMGAEQLLGQGDMLYMAGGGRISRVHGPFVSDAEVEKVVAHLKMQGQPEYLDAVTVEDDAGDEDGDAPVAAEGDESTDLYDRAVAIVLRDKKCSTSYVQRRLSVGYNKAASLVERMEKEGVVGAANHAGKRAILAGGGIDRGAFDLDD
jgi:DNA segregation ATPase FtsK/SpoIIIE, S-DNA-T family